MNGCRGRMTPQLQWPICGNLCVSSSTKSKWDQALKPHPFGAIIARPLWRAMTAAGDVGRDLASGRWVPNLSRRSADLGNREPELARPSHENHTQSVGSPGLHGDVGKLRAYVNTWRILS